jgi:transmembrane sensor
VVTAGKVEVARAEASGDAGGAGGASGSRPPKLPATEATLAKGDAVDLASTPAAAPSPRVTRLTPTDIDVRLAWQRGMLIFRGERLETVLAEFGRYTTLHFVLADGKLAGVRVGGYFQAGDIDGLLTALRENFHIESEKVGGDSIVLREAPQ